MEEKNDVKPVKIISDSPELDDVSFGFPAYITTIADLIAYKENPTPLVIGIFGKWGSGKTTLMKNVQSALDNDERYKEKGTIYRKCKTVWFQAWKYGKEEEILAALVEEIFKTMEKNNFFERCKGELEKLTKGLNKLKFFDKLVQLVTAGGISVNDFFSELEYKDKLGFYDTFQKFFDDLIWTYLSWRPQKNCFETYDDRKGVLVIFIDDLDRCPKERIIKVLETVKLFMDKRGCIFVVGAAQEIILMGLKGQYGEDAEKFMDKIVQVTFNLPQVREESFASFLAKIDEQVKDYLSPYLHLVLPSVQNNPRKLKRFINNLKFQDVLSKNIAEMAAVDFKDLLFWNIIDFNYPSLRRNIVENKNVGFFFTLQEKVRAVKEKMADDEEREKWQVGDELFKAEKIPESLHGYIKDKELAKIVDEFACTREQLLELITMSGIVESAGVSKERDEIVSRKDIGGMVKVPAGEFLYGDEKKKVDIDYTYEIGIYPVTNREYKKFIHDGGYQSDDYWSDEGKAWKEKEKITLPYRWEDPDFNDPEQPVIGVSWYEAEAYANWLSKKTGNKYRLPREIEWEKAARGTDGRVYPWGDAFDKERCNCRESGISKPTRVTVYPNGVSPYGCYDMAGNVWERCQDWYDETGSDRVLRGGSWSYDAGLVRCACRFGGDPADRFSYVGFRLAQDVK